MAGLGNFALLGVAAAAFNNVTCSASFTNETWCDATKRISANQIHKNCALHSAAAAAAAAVRAISCSCPACHHRVLTAWHAHGSSPCGIARVRKCRKPLAVVRE